MKLLYTAALIGQLVAAAPGSGQPSLRLGAMGGMVAAVPDTECGINPYDRSSNPAWLLRDERGDWLRIRPSVSTTQGDYRRLYDPGEMTVYAAGSDGVRTLGEAGTFRGGVIYTVEKRERVYRSLKRDPYAGEAFFLKDTTTGDVTFSGPAVAFQYAYSPLDGLLFGASVDYRIMDGLKYRYSNTKTLWRDMHGTLGLAWEAGGGLVAGAVYTAGSGQERLEAKSDDLLDVEVSHLRGESYAIRQRGSTVNHKLKAATHEFGLHLYWNPTPGSTLGLEGRYGIRRKQILVSRESEKDAEDGFENTGEGAVRVIAQSPLPAGLTAGCFAGLERRSDWSRHTPRDLLLWEWSGRTICAGAGISGDVTGYLLLAAEYEYGHTVLDSARYIDNRFRKVTPVSQTLRLGAELRPAAGLVLRGGCSMTSTDRDLFLDAGRVRRFAVTGGAAFTVSTAMMMDAVVEYREAGAGSALRRTFGADLRLTLLMP